MLSRDQFDALCALAGIEPASIFERVERWIMPAPAVAANVTRIVIDVINRRDGSALTFEEVARECGIEPALARMSDLYAMNEYLVDRYARG